MGRADRRNQIHCTPRPRAAQLAYPCAIIAGEATGRAGGASTCWAVGPLYSCLGKGSAARPVYFQAAEMCVDTPRWFCYSTRPACGVRQGVSCDSPGRVRRHIQKDVMTIPGMYARTMGRDRSAKSSSLRRGNPARGPRGRALLVVSSLAVLFLASCKSTPPSLPSRLAPAPHRTLMKGSP